MAEPVAEAPSPNFRKRKRKRKRTRTYGGLNHELLTEMQRSDLFGMDLDELVAVRTYKQQSAETDPSRTRVASDLSKPLENAMFEEEEGEDESTMQETLTLHMTSLFQGILSPVEAVDANVNEVTVADPIPRGQEPSHNNHDLDSLDSHPNQQSGPHLLTSTLPSPSLLPNKSLHPPAIDISIPSSFPYPLGTRLPFRPSLSLSLASQTQITAKPSMPDHDDDDNDVDSSETVILSPSCPPPALSSLVPSSTPRTLLSLVTHVTPPPQPAPTMTATSSTRCPITTLHLSDPTHGSFAVAVLGRVGCDRVQALGLQVGDIVVVQGCMIRSYEGRVAGSVWWGRGSKSKEDGRVVIVHRCCVDEAVGSLDGEDGEKDSVVRDSVAGWSRLRNMLRWAARHPMVLNHRKIMREGIMPVDG
ncbi:hypothetical protein HKX48_005513 [Thoreauomyces humboldtii]|nr:hypothetical protein HKX48_005513 [Thoreauomyces humboldtii]